MRHRPARRLWHPRAVTDSNTSDDRTGNAGTADPGPTVDDVVPAWLSLPAAAEQLHLSPNQVRQLAREGQLVLLRHGGSREPEVPAAFVHDGAVLKGLPGTLTLLADAGYDEWEAVRWLFTADDTLPGSPVDALRENRGKEVRRRAQALAF